MSSHQTESATNGEYNPEPQPWEQQQDEPLDRYRWFQVYLCLPLPRTFKGVARIVGLKPASRLIPRAANRWRWQERIAASDHPQTGCLALQSEWRDQLVSEIAYQSRFIALEETTLALAGAAIGEMDRTRARRHLNTLLQHQRGLLRPVAPRQRGSGGEDEEDDEQLLQRLVEERAKEIYWEWLAEMLDRVYAQYGPDAAAEPGNGGSQQTEAASKISEANTHQLSEADGPGHLKPWHQQPGEPAGFYYRFRIYLSLSFLQSTAQVARMAKISRKATLDKIARKWRWQQRAAAFDAEHAAQPFVRVELQDRLFRDRAYTALLQGLLDTGRALETAQLGKLSRDRARNALSSLSRHQRSLLQPALRQQKESDAKTLEERRALLLAPLIEERAHSRASEIAEEHNENLRQLGYGDESGN